MTDEDFMKIAIEEAKKGDYPYGAIIVKDNQIISKSYNTAKRDNDPTAHGEINAIRQASKKLKSPLLNGCILYTTCEPCAMCFAAAWWAKISKIVYGAEIEDSPETEIEIKCKTLNNNSGNLIEIKGGLLREECIKLIKGND
ncbi:MAG: nucleoside deaminase [Promethearchaeota archaeon]|jgi:guanine deaminase